LINEKINTIELHFLFDYEMKIPAMFLLAL